MASTFDLFPWFKNFVITPDWQRFINPQFNVTINEGDAAVENHVLSRAGSYGKQLGRVQEVLDILLEHNKPKSLSALEQRSIDKYEDTRAQVVSAVEEGKRSDGSGNVERWLDDLAELRKKDRARFDDYARQLKDFLRENPPLKA